MRKEKNQRYEKTYSKITQTDRGNSKLKNEEYHPECSSKHLEMGCSFCEINFRIADRIYKFIHDKSSLGLNGYWTEARKISLSKGKLGSRVSSKYNTQPSITKPAYTNAMKQKPNYYKALEIAAAMTPIKENEN